ncbi:MAG: Hsp70 family protein [Pseudonocardiaceae bacterium]
MGQARMSYTLGIDVGTTFTAAAICRESGRYAPPEVVPLGSRSAVVSSTVYLGQDGQVIVGEAAERRAVNEPDRVVRDVIRRIGDEDPIVIGGVSHSAAEIAAVLVRWVVDRTAHREGGLPQGITITYPAGWPSSKIHAVADALRAVDVPDVTFCTEAEAAAASYSIQQRLDMGSAIAVYDLGAGTFDAAVVRKTGTGTFSVLGVPQRIERLGGADFDAAVFRHVVAAVPTLSELDQQAAATPEAAARMRRSFALCRRECTEAKEALSVNAEVTIPVLLPEVQCQVPLLRTEFEDMIRPQVAQTIEALRHVVRSADVGLEDLDAVLLIGGCAQVPLIAQLVSTELGLPVTVDAGPMTGIALGAAVSGLPAADVHPADIYSAHPADIYAPSADIEPTTPGPEPVAASRFAGSDISAPAHPEPWNDPSLAGLPLDVDSVDVPWPPARSRRFVQFATAGVVLLAGGVASVVFMTAHRGPSLPAAVPPVAAATRTAVPAPAIPVAAVPAPNPSNPDASGLSDTGSTGDVPATSAAAPETPAGAPVKPRVAGTSAPHTGRTTHSSGTPNRSTVPSSTMPPPPPDTPPWVQEARN